MDPSTFRSFVQSNARILHGVHPETAETLLGFEQQLGFRLPASMKWLLTEVGYSMACGVENLDGSVRLTLECRASIGLPNNFLIINDWNDGGVVFSVVDNSPDCEYPVIWSDASELINFIEGVPLPEPVSRFENFPAWVADRVAFELDQEQYL